MEFNNLGNIIYCGKIYGMSEIRRRINIMKANLAKIVNYGDTVAVAVKRDENLLCLVLALIETNITFLPIDRNLPIERVNYMIKDAGAKKILISAMDREKYSHHECCYIENLLRFEEKTDSAYLDAFMIDNEYTNPVYVLYTSGTTGKPKGVEVSFEGLSNFLQAIPQIICFDRGKKIACFTTFSFDIFFLEAVLGLAMGMDVVLATENEQNNPAAMIRLINDNCVNILQMTPSRMRLLLMYTGKDYSFMSVVDSILIGGEAFPDELLSGLQENSRARIYNMYGPTETTIWSTVSDLTNEKVVDIGKPIMNTSIYLVDDKMNLVADGQVGEILIGGPGVALGYRNNEKLTKEYFIAPNFCKGDRVYRTGDLARYDAGKLIYLGRKDSQVKIRGYRVELEEIEFVINKIEHVRNSLVCCNENELICFYISDRDLDVGDMIEYLKRKLPSYMIPYDFVRCSNYKYTSSGKVDRREMVQHYIQHSEKMNRHLNDRFRSDEVALKVLRIFRNILDDTSDVKTITCGDSLKNIGVNSLAYIQAVVEIEDTFDIEFDENNLILESFGTIEDIVNYVKERSKCIDG